MEIVWTDNAKHTFYELVDYFGEYWEDKQYLNFKQRTLSLLENISKNPKMFSEYKGNIRKAVLLEKISIFYRVNNNKIIFDNLLAQQRKFEQIKAKLNF